MRQRAELPGGEQHAGARSEGRVALGQWDSDERIEPGRLGSHRLHFWRVDPHGLLHQKGIALIEQVVGDPGHLSVSPERNHEVGAGRREHLSVVSEGRRAPHLGRSFCDETGVRILHGDELHVWHVD